MSPIQSTSDPDSTQDPNESGNTNVSQNATPLDIYSASTISSKDLEACLDLIELTSSEAYAASGAGWSRPKKRKEMKLPDMKYLIIRAGPSSPGPDADRGDEPKSGDRDEGNSVLGFLSFMVTYEDGVEVVYCYEIHLAAEARGRGLGGLLMGRMEEVGKRVGLKKAMLTVFKSNVVACEFYFRGGYEVDEYSPKPRRLRNGTVKEYDYMILSKKLV